MFTSASSGPQLKGAGHMSGCRRAERNARNRSNPYPVIGFADGRALS
jgi:hypothetical protein